MPRLRHVSGAVVEVPKEKVDGLLARGFEPAEEKKAPAKKAASSKTEK